MTSDSFVEIVDSARSRGATDIVVPVARRLSADVLTPVLALLRMRAGHSGTFLFESVEGGEKLARYSFLGHNPFLILQGHPEGTSVLKRGKGPVFDIDPEASVISNLKGIFNRFEEVHVEGLPRFTGGAVGYLGYDAVRLFENIPRSHPSPNDIPEATWSLYRSIVAFDHIRQQIVLIAQAFVAEGEDPLQAYSQAADELERLERVLFQDAPPDLPVEFRYDRTFSSRFSREQFLQSVERAKHFIREGDVFQIVLSRRTSTSVEGDPVQLYRALRQVNPSPYLFYLETDDALLIGSSPEVLVRVEEGRSEVLPIAGTRRRGDNEEKDFQLERELLADPKERAEHLMLVDLGRNDLARVCEFGSVEVDRYAYVERYSHVMHIVSSVSGQLRRDLSPLDALAACFPAGTVSGAPKVRAMELIDELEPEPRGVYAGTVGYIDFAGNMDTCIAIRTMAITDGRVHLQAGAGIVADSDPEREFDEAENKLRALYAALELAANNLRGPSFDDVRSGTSEPANPSIANR